MSTKVRLDSVSRPWGCFYELERQEGYVVKKLILFPGRRTSLLYHEHRSEVWTVSKGTGVAWHLSPYSDNQPVQETIGPGDIIRVNKNEPHRIENASSEDQLIIIEVQLGEICDEEDIVRIADDYGRVA